MICQAMCDLEATNEEFWYIDSSRGPALRHFCGKHLSQYKQLFGYCWDSLRDAEIYQVSEALCNPTQS